MRSPRLMRKVSERHSSLWPMVRQQGQPLQSSETTSGEVHLQPKEGPMVEQGTDPERGQDCKREPCRGKLSLGEHLSVEDLHTSWSFLVKTIIAAAIFSRQKVWLNNNNVAIPMVFFM